MAAVRLTEELVARGVDGITVLGDEAHAPYNRILLSAVLEGSHRVDAITLRPLPWYADHGVDLRLGVRVVDVHPHRRVVELADRSEVPYDRLVLATGSNPTLPPVRGLVRMDGRLHEKVHAFRHLDDCTGLLAAVEDGARRAVVVGGGLLGLQVARALSVRGIDTEIVEGGGHLLRSQVDEAAGEVLRRSLERLGTRVYTGARVVRMTEEGVRLDNGVTLDTDLVVLTAGGRPSANLARRAGLTTRRGIVVDDTLATSDPAVFALGDCAEHGGRTPGFVSHAWEQAAVLAERLAGGERTYDGHRTVARLRATDLDVAVLGDAEHESGHGAEHGSAQPDASEIVQVSNPITGTHKRLVVRGGAIVGATLVGDLSQVGVITQLFDRGTVLGPREPGALLMPPRRASATPVALPDDAEVCACAGVAAGKIRACSSMAEVRETTRATTGCGGCASAVAALLGSPLVGTAAP
ncbi:FAD-dependent oxidoreductase [Nocardioides sp. AN3]